MDMKARYLSLEPFIDWRQSIRPIRWAERFGRKAPIEVEIGFGNGEYLVRQAAQHPDRDFVGIELEWASILRCLRKIARSNVRNVRLMLINAQIALERLFYPETIDQVRALFPCPWPKERHVKHRLFSHRFLRLLNSRLTCDGTLYIVTDRIDYTDWVKIQVCDTGFDFRCRQVAAQFSTKYERKWEAQGQDRFFELCLQKQAAITLPIRKDYDLQTHRVQAFDAELFRPLDQQGEITIKFKDFVYDPKLMRGMQWVFIVEDNLGQDVWIDISQGRDGWHIRPARGCTFIPTKGLQRALDLIRDTIYTLPPGVDDVLETASPRSISRSG